MRYLELKCNNKTFTNQSDIINTLRKNELYWLIDSETENAQIEIKNNTLIWYNGDFYNGDWHYGIFKDGNFYGNWENGIWEGGNFGGKWKSGINLTQDIKK